MCIFLNHTLGGSLADETVLVMNLVKDTPLFKGTKGTVRPIMVGVTIKRVAVSAMLRAEIGLRQAVGPTESAIGRKSAIEDLSRGTDAAIA